MKFNEPARLMNTSHRIVITTGITGGHFFPAVRFAEKYLEIFPDADITFALGRTVSTLVASKYLKPFHVEHIPTSPFPSPFSLKMFAFLLNYPQSVWRARALMRRLKPAALVSFGSYGSFPSVLAAWISGVPIVVHEQNRIAGWANRASALFARHVVVSFPDTQGNLPVKKVCYLGYPLRSEIRKAAGTASRSLGGAGKRWILVLGGSQGSHKLNEVTLEFFSLLTPEEKKKIAVIHITGDQDLEHVKKRYESLEIENETVAFSERIAEYYGRSTLVIARAGAGTIFELATFGLPSILIPYPHAYAHQMLNARSLSDVSACRVIAEDDLNAERLKKDVTEFLQDEELYKLFSQNVRRFDMPNAETSLVRLVGQMGRNHDRN